LAFFVARIPVNLHIKLLAAFIVIVVLLITVAIVGLQELRAANRRGEELVQLEWKIGALHQLQLAVSKQLSIESRAFDIYGQPVKSVDTTYPGALWGETGSHWLPPHDAAVVIIRRGLEQLRYDFERVQSLERSNMCTNIWSRKMNLYTSSGDPLHKRGGGSIEEAYTRFNQAVTNVADLMGAGKIDQARRLYEAEVLPWASNLERLVSRYGCFDPNGISVSAAEATMIGIVAVNRDAYMTSFRRLFRFSVGALGLALFLGYVISWSVIGPVRRMNARFKQIASGDFTQRVDIPNRDELGSLAAELNRMSEELKVLYQRLEAASQHKSQFLANMSHELRTPLNAVIGYTELILDRTYGEVSGRVRDALERVQHGGHHLLGLINDILDLSKIEAGLLTLSLAEYSMKHVVQTVVAAVEPLTAKKQLSLDVSIPPDLPAGKGDERRLRQVLLNIVGNAIKFTDVGGVQVQVAASDSEFLISVSDTGPGIPDFEQERIFEEFYQADNSSSRAKGGTGLGLSIAKRIIELHGGRMWLESRLGRGSTFWFTLPAWVEREQTNPRG
jgi:signal transduction histidine kinase